MNATIANDVRVRVCVVDAYMCVNTSRRVILCLCGCLRTQFDRRLRRESGREERDDSDGGRERGRVTGNPSEALLSLFNYHPSLALLITPTHAHTHTHVRAYSLHILTYTRTQWDVILKWQIHLHKVGLCYVGGEVSRDTGLGTGSLYAFSAADP